MSAPAVAPTICGPRPGCGLRVRLDHPKALASADFSCSCGHGDGPVTGPHEVAALVARVGKHMRDTCPTPAVRRAAALRYRALQRGEGRR
ncbi:hypothetical protein RM572_21750 [Streptomyces sp. DSM 42041]|uniref:Uncharacterized protein n=1 Tax=Streptomyces hazeniae TaxID=3075538 RepID=A0ABU2NWL6_9ACTN|nr:hypothetical protein [Streptomyces sp. DSM 42041]MDT0381386.1 hypothetical protein [Streptomyces sp. DSM 42041]